MHMYLPNLPAPMRTQSRQPKAPAYPGPAEACPRHPGDHRPDSQPALHMMEAILCLQARHVPRTRYL